MLLRMPVTKSAQGAFSISDATGTLMSLFAPLFRALISRPYFAPLSRALIWRHRLSSSAPLLFLRFRLKNPRPYFLRRRKRQGRCPRPERPESSILWCGSHRRPGHDGGRCLRAAWRQSPALSAVQVKTRCHTRCHGLMGDRGLVRSGLLSGTLSVRPVAQARGRPRWVDMHPGSRRHPSGREDDRDGPTSPSRRACGPTFCASRGPG